MTKADKQTLEWDPTWSGSRILQLARENSETYADRQLTKGLYEAFIENKKIQPLEVSPELILDFLQFRTRTAKVDK